jgi:hypothetical protein
MEISNKATRLRPGIFKMRAGLIPSLGAAGRAALARIRSAMPVGGAYPMARPVPCPLPVRAAWAARPDGCYR